MSRVSSLSGALVHQSITRVPRITIPLAICMRRMSLASNKNDLMANEEQLQSSQTPSWTRIRFHHTRDNDRIWQLLEASYKQPEALETIKEAVIKLKENRRSEYREGQLKHSLPYVDREAMRKVDVNHPLRNVLRLLSLGGGSGDGPWLEDELIRILTWHEPAFRREREIQLSTDPNRELAEAFYSFQDKEFLDHATPIILMLCPNLESLVYRACPYPSTSAYKKPVGREHPLRNALLLNNYGRMPQVHLQKLRHVRIVPEDLYYQEDDSYQDMDLLEEIRLFHRLPSIQAITVDGITKNNDSDSMERFPPHTSNIKRLHVGHSMLPSTEFAALVRMPKQLEKLSVSVGGRNSDDGGHYLFYPETLGKALWDQRSSLQKLDMDVDDLVSHSTLFMSHRNDDQETYEERQGEMEVDDAKTLFPDDEFFLQDMKDSTGPFEVYALPNDREYNETIGSLHDFEQLNSLSIGVKLLLGTPESTIPFRLFEALPKSLEYLLIRGYTKGEVPKYDSAVEDLHAHRGENLPALREIHGIDNCIPSADVEMHVPHHYGSEELEDGEVQYWKYDSSDEDWLAAEDSSA